MRDEDEDEAHGGGEVSAARASVPDLREHVDHDGRVDLRAHALVAEVAEQRAIAHVLGDYVDGHLGGAHACNEQRTVSTSRRTKLHVRVQYLCAHAHRAAARSSGARACASSSPP